MNSLQKSSEQMKLLGVEVSVEPQPKGFLNRHSRLFVEISVSIVT